MYGTPMQSDPTPSRPSAPGITGASGGVPIAPSLEPTLEALRLPKSSGPDQYRILTLSAAAIVIALLASAAAEILVALIGFITNIAFYHRVSTTFHSPAEHVLGPWVAIVPVIGGLVVGVMAR